MKLMQGVAAPAHGLHLVPTATAGRRWPPMGMIRDQEGAGYPRSAPHLVTACVRSGRTGGSISQTISNGRAAHDGNARTRTGLQVPAPGHRSRGAIYRLRLGAGQGPRCGQLRASEQDTLAEQRQAWRPEHLRLII